jgi:hypothetical protein
MGLRVQRLDINVGVFRQQDKGGDVRSLHGLVAAALLSASTWALAAAAAEFSIRWDPADGGPDSVTDSLAVLGLKQGRQGDFVVQYFTVDQHRDAPADYKAIGRQRRTGNEVDATYKFRGPVPIATDASHPWVCPLDGPAQSKSEVDITWTGEARPKRAYSHSCTVKADMAQAMPAASGAQPLGCETKTHRFSDHGVTLEVWELPGGRRVFEVSVKGRDSATDLKAFQRRVVGPLLSRGVRPLSDSKTELGSAY